MKFRPLSIDYQLQVARRDDFVRWDRLARDHGAVRVIQKVVTSHASVVHAVPVGEVLTVHHQVDERHDPLRRELDGDEGFSQPAILLDAPGDVFEPHQRRAAGFCLKDPGDVPMRLLLPRQHRRGRLSEQSVAFGLHRSPTTKSKVSNSSTSCTNCEMVKRGMRSPGPARRTGRSPWQWRSCGPSSREAPYYEAPRPCQQREEEQARHGHLL